MSEMEPSNSLPPRIRRVMELVYGVEGVTAAKVWQWPGSIAVGVRGSATTAPTDLLRRVEAAISAVRDPQESWQFGFLEDL